MPLPLITWQNSGEISFFLGHFYCNLSILHYLFFTIYSSLSILHYLFFTVYSSAPVPVMEMGPIQTCWWNSANSPYFVLRLHAWLVLKHPAYESPLEFCGRGIGFLWKEQLSQNRIFAKTFIDVLCFWKPFATKAANIFTELSISFHVLLPDSLASRQSIITHVFLKYNQKQKSTPWTFQWYVFLEMCAYCVFMTECCDST